MACEIRALPDCCLCKNPDWTRVEEDAETTIGGIKFALRYLGKVFDDRNKYSLQAFFWNASFVSGALTLDVLYVRCLDEAIAAATNFIAEKIFM